MINLDIFSN